MNPVEKKDLVEFIHRNNLQGTIICLHSSLKSFGFVTPKVHMRAELKRINTVVSTPKQKNEVEDCFNYIDNNIF